MNKLITQINKAMYPVILTGFIVLSCLQAISQTTGTGTCTVLKQPCNEADGILVTTITSGLTPPLTFQYSYYTSGSSNSAIIHSNVNSLTDTLKGTQGCTYVYVYDAFQHSCSITNTGMVAPFTMDYPVVTPVICPGKTGTAKITINSGTLPDTVTWFQNINGLPVNKIGTGNPMNLPAGSYIALVSAKGCRAFTQLGKSPQDSNGVYSMLGITTTSNIKFSAVTTNANCTNGTATVSNITGGVSPYAYHWANGATTAKITNLSMGSYPVTVSDSQGCSTTTYTYVNQTTVISVTSTISKPTCLQNDGSVIAFAAGGLPPYTYLYSNGVTGQKACCLTGGSYLTIYATDANGCKGQAGAYLQSTTPITVTFSTIPSSCTTPTGSATLNITGGTGPYIVEWNSYPVQTGVTVSNRSPGTISFKVTDSKGCMQTGSVVIPPQSTISASLATTNPVCPANVGAIYVNATGTNPPFTYLWNTGSTDQQILDAPLGVYSCKITDANSCSVTKSKEVKSISPVSVGLISDPASCLYAADGGILAIPTGGSSPYTFHWSNGQTGDPATGLSKGYYYVYVSDANGCKADNHTNVGYNANNDSCFCTIKGKVFVDQNNNCQFDSGENGVEHIMIHCKGYGYTYSDANGDYSFQVPTGNYILSESVQSIYPLASCETNQDTVDVTANHGCIKTVNFANIVNPLHDINIITTSKNSAVRGNNYTQSVIVQNDGTIAESNIQLQYKHDGQLNYLSTSPNIYTQPDPINKPNLYDVSSGFPQLSPGESIELLTNYLVPVNIPLGTGVIFTDTAAYTSPMSNWLTDYTPWNNVNNYETTVLGSFDPNFIEVLPQGGKPKGYIPNVDSVLTYTIHFQNSGSYFAENIVLVDTLNKNLDITSLKPGYSNYKYTADVSETGVLKFTFKNIHLTWQSQSELASCGLVTFSIKHKPNLIVGTEIPNAASIYFDYNEPVNTNIALNTIYERVVGIKEAVSNKDLNIYPNPANSFIMVKYKSTDNKPVNISIYDITGRMLQKVSTISSVTQKISISNLTNGIYFLELMKANGEKSTLKFVKE